jgi:hypothetical protein
MQNQKIVKTVDAKVAVSAVEKAEAYLAGIKAQKH